jgi:hypothetical protein
MTLGMSCGCSQTQTLELGQRQTLAQRHTLVLSNALSLRLTLIQTLTGDEYRPEAKCPKCFRKLTPVEILSGFNNDPVDFTTCCSGCGHRFEPQLICFSNGVSVELPFYCDRQTLARMVGLDTKTPKEIALEHMAIYRAAIFHHGTLKNAFKAIGIEYKLELDSQVDLEDKLGPFLGHLPDTLIAMHAGISTRRVHNLRKKLDIPKYSVARAMEDVEEEE